MNIVNASFLGISLLLSTHIVNATNCASINPQGPAAIISCLATQSGRASALDYWNNVLFSHVVLDTYCFPNAQTPVYPKNTAQTQIWNEACTMASSGYFSYDNFIAADAAMAAAAQAKGFTYTFLRNGDYNINLSELANFLATVSQETTGNGILPIKYQQDGLFFRWENGYLGNICYVYPPNPNYVAPVSDVTNSESYCNAQPLSSFVTRYWPFSSFVVAVANGTGSPDPTTGAMSTPYLYYSDQKQDLTKSPMEITFGETPNILPGGNLAPPAGYYWQFMNVMIEPGYWVGLGNLQLTKESMTQFFGWYNQHLAAGAPVNTANFQLFVNDYLVNGQLAWEGGIWYWNYRKAAWNGTTVHIALTADKAACHDIGLATYMVNGGCNDDTTRSDYYTYYKSNLFKLSTQGVPFTYNEFSSNSMQCTPQLYTYCTGFLPTLTAQ
ncbi:MAG: hypothetical protein NTW94_00200 [Legionellales bacterium]|nr:hypothetical protein [Legionellales bacterium]